MQSVDGYMNIALEKCEEHVNGAKKRSYGDAFIRGNNGMYYALPSTVAATMLLEAKAVERSRQGGNASGIANKDTVMYISAD